MKKLLLVLFLSSIFGQAQKQCGYKDGLQEGNCIFYYDNGQKHWDQNWKKGKLDGNYIAYFENGKEKAKGVYKKGQKVGEWIYFDQQGTKTGMQKYTGWKGNVYSGDCEETIYSNGKIESISFGKMVNGNEEGKWKTFFENGKLKAECNFVNGEKEGELFLYKEDGTLEKTEVYKKGKLVSGK
jgi:antitoxin component YwqK of YwqJK toxin-antitoxin module